MSYQPLLISWPLAFYENLIFSGECKIGKLWSNKDVDMPYEIKETSALSHLNHVNFKEINMYNLNEFSDPLWIKRTRMIKNPNPKPNGRIFGLIPDLHHKEEIEETLLVAKVKLIGDKEEMERGNLEIRIYILGEELENDVKSFFSSFKTLEQNKPIFAVKEKPEIELQ